MIAAAAGDAGATLGDAVGVLVLVVAFAYALSIVVVAIVEWWSWRRWRR